MFYTFILVWYWFVPVLKVILGSEDFPLFGCRQFGGQVGGWLLARRSNSPPPWFSASPLRYLPHLLSAPPPANISTLHHLRHLPQLLQDAQHARSASGPNRNAEQPDPGAVWVDFFRQTRIPLLDNRCRWTQVHHCDASNHRQVRVLDMHQVRILWLQSAIW